jgi:hypothetical protein
MTFDPDEISRREFVSRTAKTVAGVALGGAAAAAAHMLEEEVSDLGITSQSTTTTESEARVRGPGE